MNNSFSSSPFNGRRNMRARQTRSNILSRRIPRSLTANAPFLVGKNRQILSVPSHTDGLTITRSIRHNINVAEAGPNVNLTFNDVFTRFLGELNITLPTDGRLAFSPQWVNFYHVNAGASFASCAVRIFDEPRANTTAGAFVNTPFFEAVDTSTMSGLCCVKAVIPKAATYTISSDDPPNLKLLPFLAFGTQTAGQVIVDIGGTFTLKNITGATFNSDLSQHSSIDSEPAVEILNDLPSA